MPLLQIDAVSKLYRVGSRTEVRALDNVSLSVAAGSFMVLTGASGSGKSTLLAVLGALERPTQGRILYRERDLTGCSDVELTRIRRRMGFVFQDFALIPGLSVWENITYPLIPRGVRRAARQRVAALLLERLGLSDKIHLRPTELSGGEQQRVAVARALADTPEVLLADEPTSNLDGAAAEQFLTLLLELQAEGKTLVMVTHDPQLIHKATRCYTLQAGRLQPPAA
jgi:putative ABC transport system ATP-binding protein